jgi:hypothetical protein
MAQFEDSSCIRFIKKDDGDPGNNKKWQAEPIIDPDECNALTCSESGLRVPQTSVTGTSGPAPGRIADAWQSIDVVVAPRPRLTARAITPSGRT